MTKKLVLILLIIVTISISCKENQKPKFSLEGKTKGVENGMVIYLISDEFRDSTIIENNTFNFKTKLPYSPIQARLLTKDRKGFNFIVLEDNSMTFEASDIAFQTINTTGSKSDAAAQELYKAIKTISGKEREKVEMNFIENNPNNPVSATRLTVFSDQFGKDKTAELFEKFSERNKNSKDGKRIVNYLKLAKEPKIGDQYTDFEMMDQNRDLKKLSEVKRKITFLDFWASWCVPCRKEHPGLIKTLDKFKSKGFEIVSISLDSEKERWLKAIQKDNVNWVQLSDLKSPDNLASVIYGVGVIPDNFLIDENGTIIGRGITVEELNDKLHEIL